MKLLTWLLYTAIKCCSADEVWRAGPGTLWTGIDHEAALTEPGRANSLQLHLAQVLQLQKRAGVLEKCEQELQNFHRSAKNTSQLDTED